MGWPVTGVGPEALDLLTVREVAVRLSCSPKTVWRLVWAERDRPGTGLESVKLGSSRKVAPEVVIAYKQRLRDGARAGAA
jgi:hypothetical protein